MFEAGDQVAGYTVDSLLGSGASADVYQAHDEAGRTVALKILHADARDHIQVRDRFEREFAIASLLDNAHIVSMIDSGEVAATATPHRRGSSDPTPTLWLAMQFVGGPSALSLIPSATTAPDVPLVSRVARQIAGALDYAHHQDVLHRDVKPANIMLTSADPDADALLTDFGIAQLIDDTRPLARNGRVQGSIAYASPELLQAQQLSPATDQYALACSLVELLTGLPPFPRATPFAITYAHIRDAPPKLTRRREWLPSSLNAVFAKALAKRPADRYPTCADFVDIVTRALRDVPVPNPTPPRFSWLKTRPLGR